MKSNKSSPKTFRQGTKFNLQAGYRIGLIKKGLTYPTSMTFDDQGYIYIGEAGYSYGPAKVEGGGKIKRIDPDGGVTTIASGFDGPLTGVTWHKGYFYAITGSYPGKVFRVDKSGRSKVLIDGLPTGGDHYTSNIIFDSLDRMYFGTGTYTNSAIVGIDNFMMGWLASHSDWHDIPPRDYVLCGKNYRSLNPFNLDEPNTVITGAFHQFGAPSQPGEIVRGKLKANGVIYRANADGTGLEQYANGLRNPFALGFSLEEKLICVDQGYDARGSRPIANAPDPIWQIKRGGWYGFPDYVAGIPVTNPRFKPENEDIPEFVLAEHPPLSGTLLTTIEPHAAAMKFDFSRNPAFGYVGDAFVALFGSLTPMTGKVSNHPGHRIVRVNLKTGTVHEFLAPGAEHDNDHPTIRPIEAKFSPDGKSLYVLDFGKIQVNKAEIIPWSESGTLWHIRRE